MNVSWTNQLPHRQTAETKDGGEGRTLSLCHLTETQPQAGESGGAVVLSEVSGDEGGGRGCTMKLGQSRSSDCRAARTSGRRVAIAFRSAGDRSTHSATRPTAMTKTGISSSAHKTAHSEVALTFPRETRFVRVPLRPFPALACDGVRGGNCYFAIEQTLPFSCSVTTAPHHRIVRREP